MDGDGDGGRCRDGGDGLAVGGGIGGVAAVGLAPPVACRVFSVAVRAVVAPSSSSFKSVRARLGWGRRLPVQLALEVPAAPLAGPSLRGRRLSDRTKNVKLFFLFLLYKYLFFYYFFLRPYFI